MEGLQQTQKMEKRFPWIRVIVAFLVSLLIATATLLAIFRTGLTGAGYWLAILGNIILRLQLRPYAFYTRLVPHNTIINAQI